MKEYLRENTYKIFETGVEKRYEKLSESVFCVLGRKSVKESCFFVGSGLKSLLHKLWEVIGLKEWLSVGLFFS